MHFALTFDRVGKTPGETGRPCSVTVLSSRFRQIELAAASDPIPDIPQPLIVSAPAQRQEDIIARPAKPVRLQPGRERYTHRCANRGIDAAVRETHPSRSESVDVWRLNKISPRASEVIEAVLIVHDEKDVWLGVHMSEKNGMLE